MTWLVWRQYRLQAAIAAALLAAFAAVMLVTGLQMASQWHSILAGCTASDTCGNLLQGQGPSPSLGSPVGHDLVILSVMVPAVLGIFWGAPLVAHEIETGTRTFALTQSVTRTRWLAVKAGWLLLAAAAWGGAVAALVTWWSGPKNALDADAFQPNYFDQQGIVPIGYALFATALGIAAGTLLRRTLPAIAIVIGGFIGLRLAIDAFVRQHYMTAVTSHYNPISAFTPSGPAWVLVTGAVNKQGQVFSASSGPQVDGVPISALPASCQNRLFNGPLSLTKAHLHAAISCIQSQGFRGFTTYQPASRYWAFQGIETGIYVALAAALIAVTFVVVSRRDA